MGCGEMGERLEGRLRWGEERKGGQERLVREKKEKENKSSLKQLI